MLQEIQKRQHVVLGLAPSLLPSHYVFGAFLRSMRAADAFFHNSAVKHFQTIYFEADDAICGCIAERFNQRGFRKYGQLQALLMKRTTTEDFSAELQHVTGAYADDIDFDKLVLQLALLCQQLFGTTEALTLESTCKSVRKTPNFRIFLSEVVKLVELILAAKATNALSEQNSAE